MTNNIERRASEPSIGILKRKNAERSKRHKTVRIRWELLPEICNVDNKERFKNRGQTELSNTETQTEVETVLKAKDVEKGAKEGYADRPPPLPPRSRRNVPTVNTRYTNEHDNENHILRNSWPRCGHPNSATGRHPFYTNVICTRSPAKSKKATLQTETCGVESADGGPVPIGVLEKSTEQSSPDINERLVWTKDHITTNSSRNSNVKRHQLPPTQHTVPDERYSNNQSCFDHPTLKHTKSITSVKSCPEIICATSKYDEICCVGELTKVTFGSHSDISTRTDRSIPHHSHTGRTRHKLNKFAKSRDIYEYFSVRRSSNSLQEKGLNSQNHIENKLPHSHKNSHINSAGKLVNDESTHPDMSHKGSVSRRKISDEQGSISGSFQDNSVSKRSFDVSRENSIVSEEEVANICGDLRRLNVNTDTEHGYVKVLASPRVSPDIFHAVPGVVVTSDSDETSDSANGRLLTSHKGQNFLSVPKKILRRKSTFSITSGSEESDCEPSPPLSRRGRRAAIVDTKNFGDVSPSNLSPDISPSNSCDEGEGASNLTTRLRRRRSSVDLAMSVYPGDLLVNERHKKLIKRNTVADFHTLRHSSSTTINEDGRKTRQSFSLLKLMKSRSKEALSRLEDVLANMKPTEFKDNYLAAYKSLHWSDLIASSDKPEEPMTLSDLERKRREAVWELFKSECVFLIDHLMVLKHCFMEPLKKVQVEGHLMYAEPQDLFGNLDEICYVSYTFCKDFIAALLRGMSSTEFGSTRVLLKAFDRFSTHSKDGDIYHTYCLNYTNALTYLDQLRRRDDFCEFEKWCEQDQRCKRLQLTDLLVAPMQHCTKLPLLLNNIRKYTECHLEIEQLTDTIERVESSLQNMEDKMKWVKNYERVQEIQRQLSWPPVTELDPRVFIPEYLKSTLLKQPCERLLACPKRQLLHEGQLILIESTKTTDVYLFLFDDILLITRIKKTARKKSSQNDTNANYCDKLCYTVHKQPVALDRLSVHDVSQSEAAANGIKCALVIVQISRFQQIIGVYTFQCPTDAAKNAWLEKLSEAKDKYSLQASLKEDKLQDLDSGISCQLSSPYIRASPKRQRRIGVLQDFNAKSLSVDSVYI